jgi:hypothetical protein
VFTLYGGVLDFFSAAGAAFHHSALLLKRMKNMADSIVFVPS